MYMDIHDVPGATAQGVAAAHLADVAIQAKHGVEYHKYWLNEAQGKIFCLCTAPSAEAAMTVHREAHGLVAQKIIEIAPEVAESFLGGCEVDAGGAAVLPAATGAGRDCGIRTILFTDIVGSTSMTQRLGDEAVMALIDVHDVTVRDAVAAGGGREIKHTGDGIMAAFASAAAAVRCAARIQKALAENPGRGGDSPVMVRIGAAAGEPVESNRDLFGSTVQLAARLCSHAEPEQTLVSNVVAELCIGKGLTFRDLGEILVKGFDRPIRVHAVQ
jgi:class 3 adenylate cyclase